MRFYLAYCNRKFKNKIIFLTITISSEQNTLTRQQTPLAMSINRSQRAPLSDITNKENLAPIQTNVLKRSLPFKMSPFSPKEKKRTQEKFFCKTCSQQFQNRSKAEHHARKYFGIPWTKPVSQLTDDEKMKLTSTVGAADSPVT
ncbi:PATZ1, partial [Acrasis kona]